MYDLADIFLKPLLLGLMFAPFLQFAKCQGYKVRIEPLIIFYCLGYFRLGNFDLLGKCIEMSIFSKFFISRFFEE